MIGLKDSNPKWEGLEYDHRFKANNMSKQEMAELFEEFLNENGQWHTFKNWLQEKGYDLTDVCMTDED